MLDTFCFTRSDQKCWKLVEARPALSQLASFTPYEHRYRQGHVNILEKLLGKSLETLQEFRMSDLIFRLTRLDFPPMVNLKKLVIFTGGGLEQVLDVLQCTNYSERLPALAEIEIFQHENYDLEEREELENALEDIPVPAQPHSSAKVSKLHLSVIDTQENVLQEFSLVFPNVSELVLRERPNGHGIEEIDHDGCPRTTS